MGRIATVLSVVLVLACGSRNDNPTPIPAPGAGSAPPPELPPDPGRVDRIAWRAGPPLPAPRDHHVTFVTSSAGGGGWVWVAGGTDYRIVFRDIWRMRLTPEGQPSAPWERAGELPEPRAGLSVTQTEAMVILTGGQDSTLTKRTEVWSAAIKSDGVLGAWSVAPPLPSPRFHHASAFHEGYVFVIGGLEVWRRWRERDEPGAREYYAIAPWQRAVVGVTYVGLIAVLALAMNATHLERTF